MGEWFDELARTMAQGISRRDAIRRLGGGLMAVALASVLPQRVSVVSAQDACGCEKGQACVNNACTPVCDFKGDGDGFCDEIRGGCTCELTVERNPICARRGGSGNECISSDECPEGEGCIVDFEINGTSPEIDLTGFCATICKKKKDDDDDEDDETETEDANGTVIGVDDDKPKKVACLNPDGSWGEVEHTGGGDVEATILCDPPAGALESTPLLGLRKLGRAAIPTQQGLREIVAAEIQLQPLSTTNSVNIALRYTDADVAGIDETTLRMFYYHQGYDQWVQLPATVDPVANTVTVYNVDVSAFLNTLHRVAVLG